MASPFVYDKDLNQFCCICIHLYSYFALCIVYTLKVAIPMDLGLPIEKYLLLTHTKSYEVIFIKSIWPSIFTNNFKVSRTMSHGISIDLTHVPAPVIRLHSLQLQSPNIGLWPFEWNPRIARNHIIVDGENSLRIHSNPSYLQRTN